jgi:uncharacterized sulfatase
MKTLLVIVGIFFGLQNALMAADKPNILWLTSEDHGIEMGCYGDKLARTPHIDALAAKGMRFNRAWSVAPVCAPARTAIITGLYPSSTGALHMRSMVSVPSEIRFYPQFLREVGYYCTNNSKTDYNARSHGKVWDESSNKAHWRNRDQGQPFFAIFNSTKSHESQIRTRPHKQITDPAKVRVPSYHPDAPEVREDWAQYYDKVSEADADAGKHLKELVDAGLADDTIVFYYGDHGSGMPRSKRWPGNSGLHVPMVVYFPEKWQHLAPEEYSEGGSSDRLISFVDLAPTVLSIAGIEPPAWMQGHAFAGPHQSEPQPFIYGERGRMDERMDLIRSVTDGRYVYLRNYFPHVSQAQQVAYQFETPTTRVWFDRFAAGQTTDAQSIFWQVPKASEELYDLTTDRDEVINLAESPEHQDVLKRLREAQQAHMRRIADVCLLPEPELHSRSAGSTPYELARSPDFPLERIIEAAEVATSIDEKRVDELTEIARDRDSAVRYWAAIGFLNHDAEIVTANEKLIMSLLQDGSPSVQIVAAECLGARGGEEARAKALATLKTLAPPKANGVLVSMNALSAIEALGPRAQSLHEFVANLDQNGPMPDGRYSPYVPRLVENIVPRSQKIKQPITKQPKAK